MKRMIAILLTIVMALSCTYTVMANDNGAVRAEYLNFDYKKKINIYPRINIVNGSAVRDISLQLDGEYITKNGILMVPAVEILKEIGFDSVVYDSDTKTLSGHRTSDQREVALNCDKTAEGYYGFTIGGGDIIYGNTMIDPIVVKGIPLIAIKDLVKLTGDQVYVDAQNVTFYIVLNKGENVASSIIGLPTAGAGENTIVYKYSDAKAYQAYIIIDNMYLDISETTRPRKVGWDVMIEAESLFKVIGANVTWSNDKKCLVAKKNSREMSIYYDGTNYLTRGIGGNTEQKKADVSPRFVDGTALVYYYDVCWLLGGDYTYSNEDTGDILVYVKDLTWKQMIDAEDKNDDGVKIKVNGTRLMDAQAILKNGITLLPVRSVSTALGGNVTWDNVTKTVTIEKDGTTVIAPIGEKYILVDGKSKAVSIPPQIIDGKTYIPLRVIGEALSCDITWINATKTVEIS